MRYRGSMDSLLRTTIARQDTYTAALFCISMGHCFMLHRHMSLMRVLFHLRRIDRSVSFIRPTSWTQTSLRFGKTLPTESVMSRETIRDDRDGGYRIHQRPTLYFSGGSKCVPPTHAPLCDLGQPDGTEVMSELADPDRVSVTSKVANCGASKMDLAGCPECSLLGKDIFIFMSLRTQATRLTTMV